MNRRIISVIISAGAMVLLIMNTKTAISGASAGIELCLKVLIPSLFPFFVVSTYLNASMLGLTIPGLRMIGRALHLPEGSDSILIMGLLGGYPVGAKVIADAYNKGKLSKQTGHIMLGYCNNAGPAFIFGVTSTLFSSAKMSFLIWGIHIFSALVTGLVLPSTGQIGRIQQNQKKTSFVTAVKNSITITASVCSWVVIFKIIMSYLQLWIAESNLITFIAGILELSNGCILLAQIHSEAVRFILCSGFLSFGGICVLMQTASVTDSLGLGLYIPGKIIQTAISILTTSIAVFVIYPNMQFPLMLTLFIDGFCIAIIIIIRYYSEKVVEIP